MISAESMQTLIRQAFWRQAELCHVSRTSHGVALEAARLCGLWEALCYVDAEAIEISIASFATNRNGGLR